MCTLFPQPFTASIRCRISSLILGWLAILREMTMLLLFMFLVLSLSFRVVQKENRAKGAEF